MSGLKEVVDLGNNQPRHIKTAQLSQPQNSVDPTPWPRTRTVRVRGLPPGDREEVEALLEKLTDGKLGPRERWPRATVVPSCDPNDRFLDALLDFDDGKLPSFLSALKSRSPESV